MDERQTQDSDTETAMATGSDAGSPGEPGPGTSPDEGDGSFVEASAGAALAAHDDAPLPDLAPPDDGDAAGDPRTPRFQAP